MENFNTLSLPQPLMQALASMQFNIPTPIQAQAIPPALEGKDILGSAQTGTGKTAAFGIPLICRLLSDSRATALVMTPTRELAVQVMQTLQSLSCKTSIQTTLLIGGESMPQQIQQLRRQPRLIVGTPGRINDHLSRGTLMLNEVRFLVLDETDRMLDMGFMVQIEKIMKYLPQKRQTLLFSATLPKNIVTIAQKYLQQPVHISIGATSTPATNVKQEVLQVQEAEKYNHLLTQLEQREGSVIVFVKTKWGAEKMANQLRRSNHSADSIHGNLRQNQREKVIDAFRACKYRIMVATDIAARGLDIPHIAHVINYNLPQCAEDYIHRIGRTARAGAEGSALSLVAPSDMEKWREIQRLLNPQAPVSSPHPHSNGDGAGKKSKMRRHRPFRNSFASGYKNNAVGAAA